MDVSKHNSQSSNIRQVSNDLDACICKAEALTAGGSITPGDYGYPNPVRAEE